jgi:transcriptional regulator with XRE-family HTH domain
MRACRDLTVAGERADNVPMGQPTHFIRRWRKARGLSQEALAEQVGKERSYVSKIENGARKYDQIFLEAVASALRCTVCDLLARDPNDPEGLWGIYDALSADQRAHLVEIGRTFLRNAQAAPPAKPPAEAGGGRARTEKH